MGACYLCSGTPAPSSYVAKGAPLFDTPGKASVQLCQHCCVGIWPTSVHPNAAAYIKGVKPLHLGLSTQAAHSPAGDHQGWTSRAAIHFGWLHFAAAAIAISRSSGLCNSAAFKIASVMATLPCKHQHALSRAHSAHSFQGAVILPSCSVRFEMAAAAGKPCMPWPALFAGTLLHHVFESKHQHM